MLKAQKYQEKAAYFGFDWTDLEDVWLKLHEEIDELKKAQQESDKNKVEEELGDLLFTVVNLSRFMKINSEDALTKSSEKFKRRFNDNTSVRHKILREKQFQKVECSRDQEQDHGQQTSGDC